MKCAAHPDVDTNLTCGKCGRPICPRCMVETPVGARCPECARLRKLPTFSMTRRYYFRAIIIATGMAFACGAAWWAIGPVTYFSFLIAAGFGWGIGELISLSVNRKRGRRLAFIAGASIVAGYMISLFPPWGLGFWWVSSTALVIDILAVALGVWIAVGRVK
ncbi:MAG: B-box zinc finger protein [Dehalococcoidales bacterium]